MEDNHIKSNSQRNIGYDLMLGDQYILIGKHDGSLTLFESGNV
jgi:hypothetical protein